MSTVNLSLSTETAHPPSMWYLYCMQYDIADFNGANIYFSGPGAAHWSEIQECLDDLVPQFQPSDQAQKKGTLIFDPKQTNAILTKEAADRGWNKVPVPNDLNYFGHDWDAGKESILVEWQFSNYPFLWNNIIRSEAVFDSGRIVPPLTRKPEALIIVTKSGSMPASNSTLYFEQAKSQIDAVTGLNVFDIPIRLAGLTVRENRTSLEIDFNTYEDRYSRSPINTDRTSKTISWKPNKSRTYKKLSLR